MKYIINIFALFLINFAFCQNVTLNKVEKVGTNSDKFFYKINPDSVKSQYLGELDVQGFSADDTTVFDLIYKKAKSVGANAFAYKPFATIDGVSKKLDPAHYLLSLYEVKKDDFPKQSNFIYIVSSSNKPQKIRFNGNDVELQPRSYVLKMIKPGETYLISTKKFLGSSVNVRSDKYEGKQFFLISSFKVKANPYGTFGINFKSGDILKLEKSYGDFLTTIYTKLD